MSGLKIGAMLAGSSLSTQHYLRQVQNSNFCNSLFQLFDALHRPTSLINDILIESLIYQTFYHLDSEYPIRKKRPKNNSHFKLKLAINYLNDNYSDHNCSVSSLCNKIDISRSHLYNIFKAEFNISPQKYLIKIRMEKAKNRLKNTPSSIQEISVSVGYIDEFTFSKAFKKYSGFSPKAYRQMVRTDSHIKK